MTKVLSIENLYAGYGPLTVVRDLNLHVSSGEVVALLGPNGAGKTTTLLTASGLLPAIGGTIYFEDTLVSAKRPHLLARNGLAHVLEDRSLFFQLTVEENLRLGARDDKAMAKAVEYFPALEPILERQAGLLSGGEQQMLAMGRALAGEPRMLLVDEMSLGLAPLIVESMLPVLRRIADETGAGVLLVEQHVHTALKIADRGYVLSHGDLIVEGDAKLLEERNAELEASYFGD